MADPYISGRKEVINRIRQTILDVSHVPLGDVIWLIGELERADWLLEELKDRIDDAGSQMNTGFVAEGIDYVRWSRRTPRGPVTAHPDQAWHRRHA